MQTLLRINNSKIGDITLRKILLLSAVTFVGLSLGGCGNSHNYSLKKLRAEHARLLKQSKHKTHNHSNSHSTKSKKEAKQNASSKKSASDVQNKASNQNTRQNNDHHATQSNDGEHLSSAQQANVDKGLYPDGTRKPESFANHDDYMRYNAWYQGYNYDPSTGSLTRMNDQQLNDMRQQMNANGGQNFK